MIFFLVPFSRPDMASNVLSTFDRQTVPICPVVVANGCRFSATGDGLVIELERRSLGDALDVGLDAIRKMASPEDWFAKIDDDDFYSDSYAERITAIAEQGADWSGFPRVRAKLRTGALVEFGDSGSKLCAGGTLAARVDCAVSFRHMPKGYGEDAEWCRDMDATGLRFMPRGPAGYIWRRHERNTFPFSDEQILWLRNCVNPLTNAPIVPTGDPLGVF